MEWAIEDAANLSATDVAPLIAIPHRCQSFGKWLGRVKLRIDDHLALLVDVAPLADAFITNPHCRYPINKRLCCIELRIDDTAPGLFGDLCDVWRRNL